MTAVTHETIDCRSIFETHYNSHHRPPPPPTIQESSYSRITMFSRSYHRSSHLQRSTGSAWFVIDELIYSYFRSILAPTIFLFLFCFEKRAKRIRTDGEKRNREERTRGTFDGKSRRNSNGARVFRITHGTYRFKYTERACAMPRPRRPETALRFSISFSLVFSSKIVFFLKEKNIISRLVETLKKLVICDIIFFSRASKI